MKRLIPKLNYKPPPEYQRPMTATGRTLERPDRAPVAEWLDPLIYPPPRGMKIQLLTDWEIAVYGHWSDTGYVAWAPLMTKPAWLVQRLRDKALSRREKVDVSIGSAEENINS